MNNSTDINYDEIFDLSKYLDPERCKTMFTYVKKKDLYRDRYTDGVVEYQLAVYSESNATLIKTLGIIPDKYLQVCHDFQNETGLYDLEDSLGSPQVIYFLEIPPSKEEEFLLSIARILEALPYDMGGISLNRTVQVRDANGYFTKVTTFTASAIPAKDMEEHIKWCDMESRFEYQAWFKDVKVDATSVKMTCPCCGINSGKPNPRPDWYSIPDFSNDLAAEECPYACSSGVKGIVVDES